MTMAARPVIATFRPPDERAERARSTLLRLGAEALIDPMVVPEPTGALPREDADVVILTSSTSAGILEEAGWRPGDADVVAIGPNTAAALDAIGIEVELVPDTYSSSGLVEALRNAVDGRLVEVARSDHGSHTLVEGLWSNGAYVHQTVLYELRRPTAAGASIDGVLAGEVDGLAFTSSLTVEHFLAVAADRGVTETIRETLDDVAIGAIGHPTAETAEEHDLTVDVVPHDATFPALAEALIAHLRSTASRSA